MARKGMAMNTLENSNRLDSEAMYRGLTPWRHAVNGVPSGVCGVTTVTGETTVEVVRAVATMAAGE